MTITISGSGPITGVTSLPVKSLPFLVGQVCTFAMTTVPSGFLKCNGAAISRTTYATLFATIGTTYGVGDGSTTFNVPETRGEFIRNLDDGRAIDSGRVIGTAQADAFKSHTHTGSPSLFTNPAGTGGGSASGGSTNSGATGGTETRPRNIAFLSCIFTGV